MPPRTAATPAHPRAHDGERVHIDVESPRRDAVADYLLDGHLNTTVDRLFADHLLADHPQLPRLAIAAATWDRSAAAAMLDHGLRDFLVLGTGGLPIWAHSSTLTDLHDAGARIVVIEHDPVTQHLHDRIDHGAAAGRAHVLCLPADRHHDLAATPVVARLLTAGAPVGILATGLFRPAGIRLAAILALLESAPSGSRAATTALITYGTDDQDDTGVSSLPARFAEAGIPLAVENRLAADQLLGDVADVTTDFVMPAALDRNAAGPVMRTALLSQRGPRSSGVALRSGSPAGHRRRRTEARPVTSIEAP
ncbi:SAM-dependent methyltransferase [Amycolatopsis sp. CA-128772]|uniref:SAM-dependent methyltransferase n=1 Tax=Amycolatopsis sp. CA-128772 TaxID=2073159 RepID=UPI000CD1514B|nr:SAM-dependent methyltransferase [Amycolatopsis sp. CA-128772]